MSALGRGIVLRHFDRLFGEGTLTGLGDGQLLERYLTRRDEDAFEALVDLHGPMVLGLCRRMLRDPRDIEDAFQATFLVLVRKAPAIRDRSLLSSWLYGVAFRVAQRARTRTLRRRDREATVGELDLAPAPEAQERPEFDPVLDQELSRLPERYRVPLVLCYLRGRTHDQAAAELRCPVGTVRSRLARGRDLLRKRLTSRGFAPTAMAAVLGGDATLPARLLVTPVPPTLAAATIRAALGFGSSHVLSASASSLAFAQGVLTTMKLTQFKWIGMAALATSLSAGGVVAVAYAAALRQEAASAGDTAAVVFHGDGQKQTETPTEKRVKEIEQRIDQLLKDIDFYPSDGSLGGRATDGSLATKVLKRKLGPLLNGSGTADVTTEARLKTLEDKIDRLVMRLGTPAALSAAGRSESAPNPGSEELRLDDLSARNSSIRSGQDDATSMNPIGALEAELKLASDEHFRINELVQRNVVGPNALAQARTKVLVIVARVEAIDDQIKDELDRLQLERRKKGAQLERARAHEEVAAALVSRNSRLNQRKPGIIVAEDVAQAEGQLTAAAAESKIAEVEIAEVELRRRQFERRRDRIKEVAKLARDAKGLPPDARTARPHGH